MAQGLNAKLGAAAPAPGIVRRARAGIEDNPWGVITAFLAPALALYLLLTAWPILKTFYNSVHLIQPNQPDQFVGLANYVELLTADLIFDQALVNTLIWATVAPIADVTLGLLLAACLYVRIPASRFFRVAWFSPVLISYVVVGVIWMWIYNYDWGAANGLLRWLGLGDMGACLARGPAHGAVGDHPGRCLEMGRLPHGRLPRRPAFAAARGDRGGRARQLRLLEKAVLRRDPDDQDDAGGPADPRLHRQDEGVRPGLDHDQGRARCGAPRRSPPTPTSGRSNGRPSISATPRRSRWSRSCW